MGAGLCKIWQKLQSQESLICGALLSDLAGFMLYCSEDFCAASAGILVCATC